MNFHLSAQNVHLEGTTLVATVQNGEGEEVETQIDLNAIIGNSDGMFDIFWFSFEELLLIPLPPPGSFVWEGGSRIPYI